MPNQKNKFKFLLLTLVFIIPSFLPLIVNKFFTFHDEVQIVNLHQYIQSIDLSSFPPRWAPDMHFKQGSPFPEFNYQLPYYLGFVFNKVGFPLTDSFKIILGTAIVLGAVGVYYLSLKFISPFWAFVAATVYTYIPYRAVVTYVRGTPGEALAFGLFPWVFLSLYRLKDTKVHSIIFASVCVAALILTHQLATILVLPFILLIILGNSILSKQFKVLTKQLVSLILGLFISIYYWLPVALERKFIQESSPFNFYDHFPFLKQLLYSPWGYGASNWGPYDDMSFQLGFVSLAIFLLSIPFVFKKTKNKFLFLSIFISVVAALFLMNIRSSFFWDVFPFTQLVQFPWRLLMITTFLTPLLLVMVSQSFPKKLSYPLAVLALFFSFVPNLSYFQPGEVTSRTDDYYIKRYLPFSESYLNHAEDYVPLPVGAIRPKSLAEKKISAIRSFEFTPISENPLNYKFGVGQPQTQPFIFHTFNYPGWRAAVDDQEVAITPDDQGRITFVVPEGKHTVHLIYDNTPIRKYSNLISLITAIFLFEWFLFGQLASSVKLKS